MAATEPSVRVGIFGTGGWARRTHIPHLIDLGAQIVCLCDAQAEAVDAAGDEFGIATRYTDGHQMLAEENLDVLYSCVPAYARTDVEATADGTSATVTFSVTGGDSELESFLRTRIGTRLYHANHVTGGARLLLVRLPEERDLLRTLLLALAASASGFRVEWLETDLPINELALAAERFKVDALVMTSGHAERSDLIRRQLPRLGEQLDVPLCLVGPVTRIRGAEL